MLDDSRYLVRHLGNLQTNAAQNTTGFDSLELKSNPYAINSLNPGQNDPTKPHDLIVKFPNPVEPKSNKKAI